MASGALALSAAALVLAQLDADVPETHGHDTAADGPPVSAWTLLWRIKTSCFGTFAYGYFQASVVLFLPLFLIESKGIAREQTILVPAFFAAVVRGRVPVAAPAVAHPVGAVREAAGSSFAKTTAKAAKATQRTARCASINGPPKRSKSTLDAGGPSSIPAA